MNMSAALLIRSGFGSRLAAIKVVTDTGADFTTGSQLRPWLRTELVRRMGRDRDWPTTETHALWLEFLQSFRSSRRRIWDTTQRTEGVNWFGDSELAPMTPVRLVGEEDGSTIIMTAYYQAVGRLDGLLNPARCGLTLADVSEGDEIDIAYLGPDDLDLE